MKDPVKILKSLSDKNRIRIVKLLEKRKLCVCELAFILGITQPSVSRHLKKLKAAGLIKDEQEGFWTNYFLAKPRNRNTRRLIENVCRCLNGNPAIKCDLRKARKVNRTKLCCR
jgi:ArsR family transcriptional regulator